MEVNQAETQESTSVATHSPDSGVSVYFDYPASRPFINTDFVLVNGPVNTFPTSDRDAVISALRNLQENIKKLELERNIAEQNLLSLASETQQYKELLSADKSSGKHLKSQEEQTTEDGKGITGQTKELERQLLSAEHHCQLLEKELDQMRKMVENSEQSRKELMEQTRKMQQERTLAGADNKLHIERLNELERELRRLILTQTLAESKIRELEQKVKEERMHRERLQARTAQLESVAHSKTTSSPDDMYIAHPAQVWRTKKPCKKKKKVPSKHLASTCRSGPMRHYRLNLADIPFVAGKSTSPSHSLGANVQKVLAMLKLHNTALCSQVDTNGDCHSSPITSAPIANDQDVRDLLIKLQDEFGQLSSKHQETMEQLHIVTNVHVKEKLQQELHELFKNMESKCQQISKIRQHQQKMRDTRKVHTSARGAKQKQMHTTPNDNSHHFFSTNSKNANNNSRPHSRKKTRDSTSPARPELFMLRNMKKLQCTLQKEDLSWE